MIDKSVFRAERLTDVITRILMPGNVYAYVAAGSKRAAVIDTGFGLGPFREFVEDLLNGKEYDLILTHGHLDHAGGASQFERVWMHPADLKVAEMHTQKKTRFDFLNRDYDISMDDLDEPMNAGYLPLEYGQTFDLGNEVLEIVNLGGHTPGSVGILFRNERIILAGDACCSFTLMMADGMSTTVREYHDNLVDTWKRYHDCFDTMIYSHPHNYGGPEVMPQMIELCKEIMADKDDRIRSEGLFGRVSYIAKGVNEHRVRPDGKIANLQYTEDNL